MRHFGRSDCFTSGGVYGSSSMSWSRLGVVRERAKSVLSLTYQYVSQEEKCGVHSKVTIDRRRVKGTSPCCSLLPYVLKVMMLHCPSTKASRLEAAATSSTQTRSMPPKPRSLPLSYGAKSREDAKTGRKEHADCSKYLPNDMGHHRGTEYSIVASIQG